MSGVLLTGATGFVGSRLAELLVARGEEVWAVVRPGGQDRLPVGTRALVDDGCTPLEAALGRAAPRAVAHLAAHYDPAPDDAGVHTLVGTNVLFTARLLAAASAVGVPRLVDAGSYSEFTTDGGPAAPTLYAATKHAAAALARHHAQARGLDVVRLHLFDTYGPGDPRGKVVDLLVRAAVHGHELQLSPGGQLVDPVHVRDAVRAFAAVLDGPAVPGRFAVHGVPGGRRMPLRALGALVEDVAGTPLRAVWGGRPYRPGEVMVPWERFTTPPGWVPTVSLEDGVRELVEAQRAR